MREALPTCAHLVQSHEPVVEGLIRLELAFEGWRLWIRHRHYGGLFGDCQPAEYERLTLGEALEVLELTVDEWGPACALALEEQPF